MKSITVQDIDEAPNVTALQEIKSRLNEIDTKGNRAYAKWIEAFKQRTQQRIITLLDKKQENEWYK